MIVKQTPIYEITLNLSILKDLMYQFDVMKESEETPGQYDILEYQLPSGYIVRLIEDDKEVKDRKVQYIDSDNKDQPSSFLYK